MTKEERKYFKDKADRDKLRYLDEQKAFYDEVERIGQQIGTTTTREGQVTIAQGSPTAPSERIGSSKSLKLKIKSEGSERQPYSS